MAEPSLLKQAWAESSLERLSCDVAVIGSGPAGLAAARKLKELDAGHVMVLERESEPGGIPRHCNHYPFGWHAYRRLQKGPTYAQRNIAEALKAGVDIRTRYSVIQLAHEGLMLLATPAGPVTLKARRVLIATGVRETPRSARLVSGARPSGVINTGTLQSELFLNHIKPFKRPLIVGSELVTLSAIHTCLKAGIQPVAVVTADKHPLAPWPLYHYPRLKGIPFRTASRLTDIHGINQVEAASIDLADGTRERIACDGILLTGQFVPEASLIRQSHLELDPNSNGPSIDQYGRCSDPSYFAAGNVLRAVETAGWSGREGTQIANFIAADLANELASAEQSSTIQLEPPVAYCVPQRLTPEASLDGYLQLRVTRHCKGRLQVSSGNRLLWHKQGIFAPQQRILIPLSGLRLAPHQPLSIAIQPLGGKASVKHQSGRGEQ